MTHNVGDLKAYIIIIYHNEAFSVLVRMINSIILETNSNIIQKIILYDDFSDKKVRIEHLLQQYIKLQSEKKNNIKEISVASAWTSKVKIYQSDKREGLIRAKVNNLLLIFYF